MSELIASLLQASLWLAINVLVLAVVRPLLLALGGAPLAYRSWWMLPVTLFALWLPLPASPLLQVLPSVAVEAVRANVIAGAASAGGWRTLLVLAWGTGGIVVLIRSLRAQRRFERSLGTLRQRSDGSWQASGDPGLPALVGLWHPQIVVGPDFDARFDADQRALVLAHERSHRRNGDHWANAALLLVRCVFWFHPLLPWSARRFLRDQEMACDARTLGADPACRSRYATALLIAQLDPPVAPMTCHWRHQPLLKERITMLKQSERSVGTRVSGQLMVGGLCLLLAAAAWASQQAADNVGDQADRPAQALTTQPPQYPQEAFDNGQSGEVVLRVDIGANGELSDVRILSASNPGVFDEASLDVARRWTYRAAISQGRPVAAALRIPITYSLDDHAPAR